MKKHLLGIFAFVLAISMSAFTAPKSVTSVDEYDFVSETDPNDTFTGTRDEAVIHFGCDQGSKLCAEAYDPITHARVPSQDLLKN